METRDRDEEITERHPLLMGHSVPEVPMAAQRADGLAVAALVLSLCWLGGLGSVLAIWFAVASRREAWQAGRQASTMSSAALLLGWLGIAVTVVILIVAAAAAYSAGQPGY